MDIKNLIEKVNKNGCLELLKEGKQVVIEMFYVSKEELETTELEKEGFYLNTYNKNAVYEDEKWEQEQISFKKALELYNKYCN